jgi:hypothetical protein
MIRPEMTVLDIISRHRETEPVFKSYDALAGECICCSALFDTIGQVAEKYRLDGEKLQQELEQAIRAAEKK